MEEKLNMSIVGIIILFVGLIVTAAIGWMKVIEIKRDLKALQAEMEKGDAALHERVAMINEDLLDITDNMEGLDEEVAKLIVDQKLSSASIQAVAKRLNSVEFVTQKLAEVNKKETAKQTTRKAEEQSVEVTELHAEEPSDGMTYLGYYQLTAYEATGNACANGNMPTVGYTVACNSLALGTRIYIEGHGYYTVEDRGGMAGNVIDIYLGDVEACYAFGRQGANVYIVN